MRTRRAKTIIALLIFSVVALVGCVVYWLSRPHYTISYETTRILEPVRPDGRIDYLEALRTAANDGVTVENNAVVLLRQALGRAEIMEDHLDEYFDQLGVDVPPERGDYIPSIEEFQKTRNVSDPLPNEALREMVTDAASRPWAKDEFPLVAQWIAESESPLQTVREAGFRSRFCPPYISMDGRLYTVLLPDAQRLRSLSRLLAARAMLRLHDGQIDEASGDAHTIHRLARLQGSHLFLIETLVAHAMEQTGLQVDSRIAEHGNLSAQQAREYATDIRSLAPVSDLTRTLDVGERYGMLDALGEFGSDQCPISEQDIGDFNGMAHWFYNPTNAMIIANELLDCVIEGIGKQDHDERDTIVAEVEAEMDRLSSGRESFATVLVGGRRSLSEVIGNRVALLAVPPFSQLINTADQSEMHRKLCEMAFALAGWNADHGTWPESLNRLVPLYIESVPKDMFADGPPIYVRQDDGYLLYSVGINRTDDGGQPGDAMMDSDDVVIRTSGYVMPETTSDKVEFDNGPQPRARTNAVE